MNGTPSLSPLNYSNMRGGSALHAFGDAIDHIADRFQPEFTQLMLSTTVDELVGRFGAPVPHHIKMDVDGIEIDIIEGAHAVLRDKCLETVMLEVGHRYGSEKTFFMLEQAGFVLKQEYKRRNTSNCLFVRA